MMKTEAHHYSIEPKRELPNAPLMLAFMVFVILGCGFLHTMVQRIDAETQVEAERIRQATAVIAPEPEYRIGKKGQKIFIYK